MEDKESDDEPVGEGFINFPHIWEQFVEAEEKEAKRRRTEKEEMEIPIHEIDEENSQENNSQEGDDTITNPPHPDFHPPLDDVEMDFGRLKDLFIPQFIGSYGSVDLNLNWENEGNFLPFSPMVRLTLQSDFYSLNGLGLGDRLDISKSEADNDAYVSQMIYIYMTSTSRLRSAGFQVACNTIPTFRKCMDMVRDEPEMMTLQKLRMANSLGRSMLQGLSVILDVCFQETYKYHFENISHLGMWSNKNVSMFLGLSAEREKTARFIGTILSKDAVGSKRVELTRACSQMDLLIRIMELYEFNLTGNRPDDIWETTFVGCVMLQLQYYLGSTDPVIRTIIDTAVDSATKDWKAHFERDLTYLVRNFNHLSQLDKVWLHIASVWLVPWLAYYHTIKFCSLFGLMMKDIPKPLASFSIYPRDYLLGSQAEVYLSSSREMDMMARISFMYTEKLKLKRDVRWVTSYYKVLPRENYDFLHFTISVDMVPTFATRKALLQMLSDFTILGSQPVIHSPLLGISLSKSWHALLQRQSGDRPDVFNVYIDDFIFLLKYVPLPL